MLNALSDNSQSHLLTRNMNSPRWKEWYKITLNYYFKMQFKLEKRLYNKWKIFAFIVNYFSLSCQMRVGLHRRMEFGNLESKNRFEWEMIRTAAFGSVMNYYFCFFHSKRGLQILPLHFLRVCIVSTLSKEEWFFSNENSKTVLKTSSEGHVPWI